MMAMLQLGPEQRHGEQLVLLQVDKAVLFSDITNEFVMFDSRSSLVLFDRQEQQ